MRRIRVLVATAHPLTRDVILATISDQPDIEIIDDLMGQADLLARISETQPDFVIAALSDLEQEQGLCDRLFERFPALRVLALGLDRDTGLYFWATLNVHSDRVEASEESVLKTLRSHAEVRGGTTWKAG